VIVAGKADGSLLIERITAEEDDRMPPLEAGGPLKAEEIALIRTWINQGAETPPEETPGDPRGHWAYTKPVRAAVPNVKSEGWSRNPIDAFLAAGHEELALVPVGPVEKHILLRRVSLDLIGLPPSREQLHAFLKSASTGAYEKVVRDLLDSPRYGERWGRHWMDIWRYSDWYGLGKEVRYSQKHIWRWRDWIIESLNEDKPYNRMIVEMLAGDEIAPTDPDTLRATGFLVRNYFLFNRTTWLDDTVEHTSKAFLGLTSTARSVTTTSTTRSRSGTSTACGHSSNRIRCGWTRCPAKSTSTRTACRVSSMPIRTHPLTSSSAATRKTRIRAASSGRACQPYWRPKNCTSRRFPYRPKHPTRRCSGSCSKITCA